MTDQQALFALAESLQRLAAPASEQIAYLTNLGVADLSDELALEFDDLYRPLALELGDLAGGVEIMFACRAVNDALSSDTLGWTFDDLADDAWDLVRQHASRALDALRSAIAGDGP